MNAQSDDLVDVSVLVPVHNCRDYLDRCLTSLLIQRVSKEIVVVDDGSTDGSAELLDLYARHHPRVIRVIHQEHSGGAGRPRNVALEHARGRHVFFCDADDYLGPEALQRMLAMADRNGSDIVLGKIVGHGRRAPASMFHESADSVPLGDSSVYNSLSCFKLFRRRMLQTYGIRFDESMRVGEDIVFTTHAYCHADVISIVADYDCYHLVARPDGTSIMQQQGSRDPLSWLRMIKKPIELMTGHIRPGPLRDHLLGRHFRMDAMAQLGTPFLEAEEVERKEIAAEVAEMCERWLTEGVRERLGSIDRDRVAALADVDRLVRLAQIESAELGRELTGLRWTGDRLSVEGRAALRGLAAPAEVALTLRPREGDAGWVTVPATGDGAGFAVDLDPAGLPSGVWDVYVTVTCEGVARHARLGAERDQRITRPPARVVDGVVAMPYFTRPHGNLSLDVGGHVMAVPGHVRLTGARWVLGHRLALDGQITVGAVTPAGWAVRHLVWRERQSGRERRQAIVGQAGGGFATRQSLGRFGPGTWDAYLELDLGGPPARFRIEADAETLVPQRTWWRGLGLRTVRPYATAGKGRLSTVVRTFTPRRAIRRLLR